MSGQVARLPEEPERSFGRFVLGSALLHVAAASLLALSPPRLPSASPLPEGVVQVRLVAPGAGAPPRPAAAPPEPAPPPAPEAPPQPPPPKPQKVVLPEQTTRAPEPKPAPPKPRARPKPKPEPAPPPQALDYDDVLAQLREDAGEPEPTQVAGAQASGAAGAAAGAALPAAEAAWRKRAKLHVRRSWVLAPGFKSQSLQTEVRVLLSAQGDVRDVTITQRSGNPWYDESVERAVRKADPLPAPSQAGAWTFVFRPEDVL